LSTFIYRLLVVIVALMRFSSVMFVENWIHIYDDNCFSDIIKSNVQALSKRSNSWKIDLNANSTKSCK
jgi:hypothetical protein